MRDGVKIISLFGKESYSRKFPALQLLHEENLFLECRCCDVNFSISKAANTKLDIFEETVLRLLGICGRSIEEISDLSCFEKDFVKAICTGLQKNNFINENNVLTDNGKNYLNQTLADDVEEKNVRIISLTETGQPLKIVLQDSVFDYDGFFDGGRLSMIIDSRDAGKEDKIGGSFISCPKEKSRRNYKIPSHKVKQIIAEQNFPIAQNYALSISSSGRRAFLHVKCALQQGSVEDLIVSDGTEIISGTLVQYLRENHKDYLEKLNERAARFQADISQDPEKYRQVKYYQVKHNLDELEDFLEENSRDAEKINAERRKNNFNRLYAAVEHALNYYLRQYPVSSNAESVLLSQTPEENYKMLINFAEKIDLYVGQREYLLTKLGKITLNSYKKNSDVPVLNIVLPLAIVSGFENRNAPFAAAAYVMPDLLKFFYVMYKAGGYRHGSENEVLSAAAYSKIEHKVKKFINILLPDLREDDQKISARTTLGTSQERLNAIVELQNSLGSKIYFDANENLKNALIGISPYYSGNNMLSPVDFVNRLYICLENFIRNKTKYLTIHAKNISAVISELENFIGSPLPKSLKTVRENKFNAAVKGRNATLGAYTLAFFGFLPKDLLTDKTSVKKILEHIGEILSLRKHANNTELNLTLTEKNLNSLRQKTFDAMKFLEEF